MELERARSRSSTERGQVQQLLAEIGRPGQMIMRQDAMRLIRRSH
jgi:hypothetical protein